MGLRPYRLLCDHRSTPMGIGAAKPLLSWALSSNVPGLLQASYRVHVVSLGKADGTGRAAWDSGWVEAGAPYGALYGGKELSSSTPYEWSVQVRDQHGAESRAANSWFETGLLHPEDWQARWVGRGALARRANPPEGRWQSRMTAQLPPPCQMRKEFDLDEGGFPRRARAYVSAKGLYQLRVNGQRVGRDELTPGWTDYRYRIPYQVYDITTLLSPGRNAVAAVIADGWWCGYVGFDPRQQARHYGAAPALLAQIVVEQPDGSSLVVGTDGTWAEHPGEILYADLLMGEARDWRMSTPGWDCPGFDDSSWAPVTVLDDATGQLVASTDEPVRVAEQLPARSVVTTAGRSIVDFGQNLVGRVRLRLDDTSTGQRVVLRHGETLDGERLYTDNLRTAEATDVVITAGTGNKRVFEPSFTTHGFRYAEVTGYPGTLRQDDVTAIVLHNDLLRVGELHCSDPTVEQLMSNIWWGLRGNLVAVPTDCPQRDERLGWTADAQLFLATACFNADLSAFMARWLEDLVGSQSADGAFSDVAPVLPTAPWRDAAPAWGDAGVIIPYHLWRTYGDRRILERCWGAMSAWVAHIERHNPDLIWRHATGNNYGDWLQVDADTPRDLLATAYFARSAGLVAEVASVLQRPEEARRFSELAAKVRRAFASEFTSADGTVGPGTQTGYLLALGFDLLPEELARRSFSHLCKDIADRGHRLSTGFVGAPLLCPVLTERGRPDIAFRLLHQEEPPSWLYSVRHGATTIWERWDGWTEEGGFQTPQMNSFNHCAFGSVGAWLWEHVAGISQAEGSVAYTDLVLQPHLDPQMAWLSARYESPRGLVALRWDHDEDAFRLALEIPPGEPAEVRLPAPLLPARVAVDGEPVDGHPWARLVMARADAMRLSLPPGQWEISAPKR
ncbi:MAG TPA: family 78 glycoside hydrolase catalytic domain [Acidimicrobiales bacterium]|nr:family 78 glycoside hydrolase catalytic domain [Acidimicrobiales bacterium]